MYRVLVSPSLEMPAFMLAAELLLEVKDLLQASTILEVRDMLGHAGFQHHFNNLILPLVTDNPAQDNTDLESIQGAIIAALEVGSATDDYETIADVELEESEDLGNRATALILQISDYIGTGNHGSAVFAGG